ncbi:hypothetical protein ACLB2K_006231 [Fragaria x ananassa]
MPGLSCIKLTLFTVAGVAIQLIGLSIFVFGFFPVKPTLPGHSGPESFEEPTCNSNRNESQSDVPPHQLRSLYKELSGIPPAFDRLILMVIDDLPAEFVLGKDGKPPNKNLMEAMPYTHSLLGNGMAVGYHAKAAPPTVTMPRLKAMVSGAIGGFLDVALNFNTQAMVDDNLLGQFFKIGWKMVMLGDETWLKLFPGLFMRHDGVSSFFVKDTVQVDQNVSRHLSHELSRDDWDFLRHFTKEERPLNKIVDGKEEVVGHTTRAQCKYCSTHLAANSSANGTSSLMKHIEQSCKGYPERDDEEKGQTHLSRDGQDDSSAIGFRHWSKDACVEAATVMIVMDELSFSAIERPECKKSIIFKIHDLPIMSKASEGRPSLLAFDSSMSKSAT